MHCRSKFWKTVAIAENQQTKPRSCCRELPKSTNAVFDRARTTRAGHPEAASVSWKVEDNKKTLTTSMLSDYRNLLFPKLYVWLIRGECVSSALNAEATRQQHTMSAVVCDRPERTAQETDLVSYSPLTGLVWLFVGQTNRAFQDCRRDALFGSCFPVPSDSFACDRCSATCASA